MSDVSSINVTNPSANLPWVAGITNTLEWNSAIWPEATYNYSVGSPFNASIFAVPPSGDFSAYLTVQGTANSTGVAIPATVPPGSYKFQFAYQVATAPTSQTNVVFAQHNFTIVGQNVAPTTPLQGVDLNGQMDAASPSIGSAAGLTALAVATCLAAALLPAFF